VERRSHQRYLLVQQPSGIVQDDATLDFLVTLHNISIQGIGFISRLPIRVGLHVPVAIPHGSRHLVHRTVIRVLHSEAIDEHGWLVGGKFLRSPTKEQLDLIRKEHGHV